ncbi:MAG: polymer-forming cytoskeletal protein [Acidobacteriota bacterium]
MALLFVKRENPGTKSPAPKGEGSRGRVVPIRPGADDGPDSGSRLGPQTRFRGEILGTGSLEIHGQMEGSVRLRGKFTVERGGQVHAEMGIEDGVFRGRVSGSLNAQGLVRIHKMASFQGQILADRLQVQDGGILDGKVCVPDRS